ncbi:metabotropic glutamate receptor 3-like [Glandiceps talaboti]
MATDKLKNIQLIALLLAVLYVVCTEVNANESGGDSPRTNTGTDTERRSSPGDETWRNIYLNETKYKRSYHRDGDVVLGGLFDIHHSKAGKCTAFNARGVQWMYTMIYAIDEINKQEDFLPNITLGYSIHDACGDPNIAVKESLDFIGQGQSSRRKPCRWANDTGVGRVITVIGPRTSTASKSVASLLGLFHVPQISYASTSQLLSNPRFQYFMRTVPPDGLQAVAMTDFIERIGWQTVAALYGDDPMYSVDGMTMFESEAVARNICIAYKNKFGLQSSEEDIYEIYNGLREFPDVKAVVVFALDTTILHLFKILSKTDVSGYTWIASDAWSDVPRLRTAPYVSVVKGLVGFSPHTHHSLKLLTYLQGLKPSERYHDPFFMKFWENNFGCSFDCLDETERCCSGREQILDNDNFLIDQSRLFAIIDAVRAVAYAIQKYCGSSSSQLTSVQCVRRLSNMDGSTFLHELKSVEFNGSTGVYFNHSLGDHYNPQAWYDIENLQPSSQSDGFEFRVVGSWKSNLTPHLSVNLDAIWWNQNDSYNATANERFGDVHHTVPRSFCSVNCPRGKRKAPREDIPCCWKCYDCPPNHYNDIDNSDHCHPCSEEQKELPDRSGCIDLPQYHLINRPGVWILILVFSFFGIIFCIITSAIFFHFRNRAIVVNACAKAYLIPVMTLNVVCFLATLFPLLPASDAICGYIMVLMYLPITALLALLILTAEAYWNKNTAIKSALKRTLVISALALNQFLISVAWVTTNPLLKTKTISRSEGIIFIDCVLKDQTDFPPVIIAFSYNFLLKCIGLFTSYRTRKCADNFGEPKFLFFVLVALILIWIIAVGTFFSFPPGYHMRSKTIAFAFCGTGYAVLVCIFLPKLYVIRYKPEINPLVWSKVMRSNKKFNKRNSGEVPLEQRSGRGRAVTVKCHRMALEMILKDTIEAEKTASIYQAKIDTLRHRIHIDNKPSSVITIHHQR